MVNDEARMLDKQLHLINQQKTFLNAFVDIANKAMNEYHNNNIKQTVKEVKNSNQTKEKMS